MNYNTNSISNNQNYNNNYISDSGGVHYGSQNCSDNILSCHNCDDDTTTVENALTEEKIKVKQLAEPVRKKVECQVEFEEDPETHNTRKIEIHKLVTEYKVKINTQEEIDEASECIKQTINDSYKDKTLIQEDEEDESPAITEQKDKGVYSTLELSGDRVKYRIKHTKNQTEEEQKLNDQLETGRFKKKFTEC